MRRSFSKVVISIFAIVACIFAFAACASKSDDGGNTDTPNQSSSINGTYYLYVNGSYDKSDFIKINDESWSDKMGMTGFIEIDGASISLKYKAPAIAGMPEMQATTYYGGTIGNGVFREEAYMGIPLVNEYIKYYCKDGKTPSDLPSGGNNGNNDDPTDPSDIKRTVTFDANGGYTSTATMQFDVGATMQNMPTPTRTGYTFAGWKDSFGKAYDNTTKMPSNNITLIAQWSRVQSEYSDTYVTLSPATEGTKNILTQIEYASDVDKMLYVELTSDDIGGPAKVGTKNNFTLTTVSDMKYSIKPGYSWTWYEGNFNTPNGAQRFTLNYGSNFQFVTIGDGSGVVLQTYLVDIYVKQDYYINLYSDLDAITSFERIRVIDGEYFSAVNHTKQVCDFVFDKYVYKVPIDDRYLFDYEYNKPVTQDWNLYQTFKSKKITPELNDGILDGEITVTPYVKEQTLPIPEKEGYDFIGWKLGNKYFTEIEGNSGVNYLNALNGNETLTASFEPKHFYWYNDGDVLRAVVATPSISYRDSAKTEISNISYSYNGSTLNSGNTFIAGESATITAEKEGYTFTGWYDGNSLLSGNVSYTFTVPKNEFVYTRQWTFYTLTTDRNITSGGSVTSYYDRKITAGNIVTITANTYSGYTFLGWYDGETKLTSDLSYTFTMPEKNITYTAKWTNCPVTFEKNIATAGSINVPSSTTIGQSVTVTANTNNGYTWLGWYNGNILLTSNTSYTFTLTENTATYTAKWTEYKLTTVANDTSAGYVSNYSDQRITAGQSVTVTATTNNGYTFVGWYDGNRELTKDLSYTFTMPSANTTYTAKWIKVTLERSDTLAGTVSSLDSTYKAGESVTVTATTYNGYTWLGWYNGNTRLTTAASYSFTMPSSNVTYTAKWTYYTLTLNKTEGGSVTSVGGSVNASFTVSFNLNGGTGTVASQTVTKTVGLTYPTIPTRNGYVFAGWYNNSACSGSPFDFSASVSADTTLYAKWISYSGNGIIDYNGNKTVSVLSKDNSTKQYYAFVPLVSGSVAIYSTGSLNTYGYLYDSSKSQLQYDDDSGDGSNFRITYNVTAGMLYYVRPCGYSSSGATTVYVSGAMPTAGGKVVANAPSSETEQKITARQTVTVTAATNNGYTFVGWFDGSTRKTTDLSYTFTMPLVDVTYTAKWIKVTIAQSDTAAGTVTSLNNTYKVGDSVTVNATSNMGYIFVGWYDGESIVTTDSSYTFTMLAENKVYTAKWEINRELSNYIFTSTPTSLTIKGLVDKSVTSIEIPNIATSIDSGAFIGCNNLTNIKITDSVTSIGSGAFSGCSNLISITLPFVGERTSPSLAIGRTFGYVFGSDSYAGGMMITQRYSQYYNSIQYCIPSSLRNVKILSGNIYYGAFSGCSNLTSIEIPDGVTSIEDCAFYDCRGLTSIEIPNSVTSIAKGAFYGCSNLISMTLPFVGGSAFATTASSNTVFGYIFGTSNYDGGIGITQYYGSYGSSSYYIPASLTDVIVTGGDILYGSFSGCNRLKSVKIDNGATTIGDRAFYNCSSLTSIAFPDSVTSIGESAFYYCRGLSCVEIPNSVTSIGGNAFNGCGNLTSVTIGSCVTSIGAQAFCNCSLTSIEIPNSVTSIGRGAFLLCSGLKSVYYTGDILGWLGIAFENESANPLYNAHKLYIDSELVEELIIPNGVTEIKAFSFYHCSDLTSVTIPNSVTSIGESAFYTSWSSCFKSIAYLGNIKGWCEISGLANLMNYGTYNKTLIIDGKELTDKIIIPNGTKSIGGGAFRGCASLTNVTIPNSVTIIEESAFYGCSSLENIILPSNIKNIGESAFRMCSSLTSVTLPNALLSIGDYAFFECSSLTDIELPNGLTDIGNAAFYECAFTSIEMPDSVTNVGGGVFANCWKLTHVKLSDKITSLNYCVLPGASHAGFFGRCGNLTSIEIPNSVTSIGDYTFEYCNSLTSITVQSGNTKYHSSGNCIIETASGKLVAGCKNSVIPSDGSVTSIGDYAFYGCSLRSIEIPNNVTSIGSYAFNSCASLVNIKFNGTMAQWKSISKGYIWNYYSGEFTVTCTDGTLSKSES